MTIAKRVAFTKRALLALQHDMAKLREHHERVQIQVAALTRENLR